MLAFLLKRLGSSVLLLFVVTAFTFAMVFSAGRNVARVILGDYATEEQVALKAEELGIDQPLPVQFAAWLGRALTGDLGRSWFTSEPVVQALSTRLTVTFSIVLIVIVISAVLSVALGLAAAVRRGWVDRLVQVLAVLGYAIPGFILAIILVTVFAVQLGWFPATGFTPFAENPQAWLLSITLPVMALVLSTVASTAQQIRSSLIDVLRRDYVRTLRSRGLGRREILLRHVLRSASPPGLTVLALQFVGLLGGAVIVEQVFALPGLGYLAVQSTTRGDLPIVMGVVLATVVLVVVVNLAIDLLVGWLNPKARVS
ncbi:ABC transporter permease [Microbacterium sp. 18062]|uniref:ABC transporter permease n=1 Tax=Microbacterium sp. 18062 TaxID=2681410 RepID=UPI00135A199D|nr:ABC transporter permease [Microbacterium sp. 18062]